jgi:hypothetical protein
MNMHSNLQTCLRFVKRSNAGINARPAYQGYSGAGRDKRKAVAKSNASGVLTTIRRDGLIT